MRSPETGSGPTNAPPASGIDLDRWVGRYFRENSRTFSLATRLLPGRVRRPVAVVYWYCRTIDNIADAPSGRDDRAGGLRRLEAARKALDRCLEGQPGLEPLWTELAGVYAAWRLPVHTLHELIDGARWDLEGRPIGTFGELIAYSELVAGAIGEMMLPFLAPKASALDRDTVDAARALGVAMQITNILRDVGEDLYGLGRTYLPAEWCRSGGLEPGRSPDPSDPRYRSIVESLMEEAETRYRLGMSGIDRLDPGARLGIRAAARSYREILNEIRANRYDNVTRRAVVPLWRKATRIVFDGYERRKRALARRSGGAS